MTTMQNITAFAYDKKGRLLSVGRNSYVKTHPLQARMAKEVGEDYKIYLHAEVAALVKVKNWTRVDKLVVTRYNKNGEPMIAKPCRVCQRVIKFAGINTVEHT
jgi:deoxycytidylate deaminase